MLSRTNIINAALILCLSHIATSAEGATFTETFNTTDYADMANTTAAWDTDTWQLHLPAFAPVIIGSCETPASAGAVERAGDYVFVADYPDGVAVIDISNPAQPQLAGSCATAGNTSR